MHEEFWSGRQELLAEVWGSGMMLEKLPHVSSNIEAFFILAASVGITTPNGMFNYYKEHPSPDGHDGLAWMIDRLQGVVTWTQEIWDRAEELNPSLYEQLIEKKGRKNIGEIEAENVPETYAKEIAPISRPLGWAGPRLLILLSEKDPNSNPAEILESSLRESVHPAMLLSVLAKKIFSAGVPAGEIIELVLKHHIMREQNNLDMYIEVIDEMKKSARGLWSEVMSLRGKFIGVDKKPGWVKIVEMYENVR